MSKSAPGLRSHAWIVVMLALVPQGAQAWVGEPLCAFPETEAWSFRDSANMSSESDAAMCVATTPHLRAPMPDAWSMSGRASSAEAPLVAVRALTRARELEQKGLLEDAMLSLRVVESNMPRISDYAALMRAKLYERMGDPLQAAAAYEQATQSINGDLAARARVGRVENLLYAVHPNAQAELDALLRRYPELPEAARLKLALADYRVQRGEVKTAIATYRILDLSMPGYPVARVARERLAKLAAEGHPVPAYTVTEKVARAEKLVYSGPVELAREALAELDNTKLPLPLVAKRDALWLHLVHVTGEKLPDDEFLADSETERAANEKRLFANLQRKKLTKLRPAQLYLALQEATRFRATSVADPLVAELTKRGIAAPADVRFGALTVAAGTASDGLLSALAATLSDHPTLAAAARYHRARALERMGKNDEARAELAEVQRLDTSVTRFYANFAEQRLRALDGSSACASPGRAADCNRERIERALAALEVELTPNVQGALVHLASVEQQHGAAYPWLGRALDLLTLGEADAASDEIYETYLAYRGAGRKGAIRAGRQAVYRGQSVHKPAPDMATRRARLELTQPARLALANAASALGDWGTAAYFGGNGWAESHPHAYSKQVAHAARKYGLDPDLLFAVMRVESVYQRRIISHAGAIGLMQIMPRTGRLIADKVGRHDATTTDLLDPTTNLEFSAWYLSSLLERMDGRLPLAIASYNGGPHNVRKWIRTYGEHMPLDAFLERIPFSETKRYVRRVLGYYARYKAARGERVDSIALTLPSDKPSAVLF